MSQGGETGGFDSHAFVTERPKSKSRAASRVSEGSNDESVRANCFIVNFVNFIALVNYALF